MVPEKIEDAIADGLDKDSGIRRQMAQVIAAQSRLLKKYETDNNELQMRIMEIRSKCPHFSKTYYGDAAGGNDSHTSCDTCGMEIDRR